MSNEFRKRSIFVFGSGVRFIWFCYDLENFKKWLKVLEDKVVNDGIIFIDLQVVVLEKKKNDDEVCGEIEIFYSGYLGL